MKKRQARTRNTAGDYIRSTDGAEMVEVASNRFVAREYLEAERMLAGTVADKQT